jgi:hypothetical protein
MIGPLLPRVSDGGILTSGEMRAGITRMAANRGFPFFFSQKGAAAETLRVSDPVIEPGTLNQKKFPGT